MKGDNPREMCSSHSVVGKGIVQNANVRLKQSPGDVKVVWESLVYRSHTVTPH